MSGRYDDIIGLPRPQPRQPMTAWQRGAQFSPFAALTGFDAVMAEEGRLTQQPIQLGEDALLELNAQLAWLTRHVEQAPVITVCWFCPDSRKDGGSYVTTTGHLKKLDEIRRVLVLREGLEIPLAQILSLP